MYIPVHSLYLFCNSSHFKRCFLATDPLAPLPHRECGQQLTFLGLVGITTPYVGEGGEDVGQGRGEGI